MEIATPSFAFGELLLEQLSAARHAKIVGKQRRALRDHFGAICLAEDVVAAKLPQDTHFDVFALSPLTCDGKSDSYAPGELLVGDPDFQGRQINMSCRVPSPFRQAWTRRAASTALR